MSVFINNTKMGTLLAGKHIIKSSWRDSILLFKNGFATFDAKDGDTLTIPLGVTSIHVEMCGASGVNGNVNMSGCTNHTNGGLGGKVECDLAVEAGQVLYFTVGKVPYNTRTVSYNASDIRLGGTGLEHRIIVAGGGGSGVYNSGDSSRFSGTAGAPGGGLVGGSSSASPYWHGSVPGAGGGTQTAGGSGGNPGTLGLGGLGSSNWGVGGCGGAGYYGGGGGYGGASQHKGKRYRHGSGGGGGSSYTNKNCSNVIHTQGAWSGDGYIKIGAND